MQNQSVLGEQMKQTQKNGGDIQDLEKQFFKEQQNLDNLKLAKLKSDKEYELEIKKQVAEKTIEFAKATSDAVITITDNQYNQEIMNLNRKAQILQVTTQEEINAVNATQGFQKAKQAELNRQAGPIVSKFTTEPAALIGENIAPMGAMNKANIVAGQIPSFAKSLGQNALVEIGRAHV